MLVLAVWIFAIYAYATPAPLKFPMNGKVLHQHRVVVKTKNPAKLSIAMPIGNYASLINSHALTKKALKKPAITKTAIKRRPLVRLLAMRAQLSLSKLPMICFVHQNRTLTRLPALQKSFFKKRVVPFAFDDSVVPFTGNDD